MPCVNIDINVSHKERKWIVRSLEILVAAFRHSAVGWSTLNQSHLANLASATSLRKAIHLDYGGFSWINTNPPGWRSSSANLLS